MPKEQWKVCQTWAVKKISKKRWRIASRHKPQRATFAVGMPPTKYHIKRQHQDQGYGLWLDHSGAVLLTLWCY